MIAMFPYARELELLFANQATARNLITKIVIDTFGKLKESTSIKSINHYNFINLAPDILDNLYDHCAQSSIVYFANFIKGAVSVSIEVNGVNALNSNQINIFIATISKFKDVFYDNIKKHIQSTILLDDSSLINRYTINIYQLSNNIKKAFASNKTIHAICIYGKKNNSNQTLKHMCNHDTLLTSDYMTITRFINAPNNDDTNIGINYNNLLEDLVIEITDQVDHHKMLFAMYNCNFRNNLRADSNIINIYSMNESSQYVLLQITSLMDLPIYTYVIQHDAIKSKLYNDDYDDYKKFEMFCAQYYNYRTIKILLDLVLNYSKLDASILHIANKDKNLINIDNYTNTYNMLIEAIVVYLGEMMTNSINRFFIEDEDAASNVQKMLEIAKNFIDCYFGDYNYSTKPDEYLIISIIPSNSSMSYQSINWFDIDTRIINIKPNNSAMDKVHKILTDSNNKKEMLALNSFNIMFYVIDKVHNSIVRVFGAKIDSTSLTDSNFNYYVSDNFGELVSYISNINLSAHNLSKTFNLDTLIDIATNYKKFNLFIDKIISYITNNPDKFRYSISNFNQYIDEKLDELSNSYTKFSNKLDQSDITYRVGVDSIIELLTRINYYGASDDTNTEIKCTAFPLLKN